MPHLHTVTVRTASRMPIGTGFQEAGVSLSYVVDENTTVKVVIDQVGPELVAAFEQLWRQLDGSSPTQLHRNDIL